ncbi:hypothetical protein [Fusobacterium ulcerans]|uniref:hypothetical protein n=1 Tax=Fusobacterium ulcerans TaxID=861 RepID=UPI003FEEDFB6
MENSELLKANKEIEKLKQDIRDIKKEAETDKKIEISIKNVIKQMSSSDLLDELMKREASKEELEKIAIGFILKKIDFEESSIDTVLQLITNKNMVKKMKETSTNNN